MVLGYLLRGSYGLLVLELLTRAYLAGVVTARFAEAGDVPESFTA